MWRLELKTQDPENRTMFSGTIPIFAKCVSIRDKPTSNKLSLQQIMLWN